MGRLGGVGSGSALISSVLSMTAPLPLVDMVLRRSVRRRERPVDSGSDRAGLEGQELCGPPVPRGPSRSRRVAPAGANPAQNHVIDGRQ